MSESQTFPALSQSFDTSWPEPVFEPQVVFGLDEAMTCPCQDKPSSDVYEADGISFDPVNGTLVEAVVTLLRILT